MSAFIDLAPTDSLSQGDIIAGLSARGYQDYTTFGIIVTARCDCAHDKARVINYVPLVPLKAWIAEEGWVLFTEQERNSIRKRLFAEARSCAKKTLLTESEIDLSLVEFGGSGTGKLILANGGTITPKYTMASERFDELGTSLQTNVRPKSADRGILKDFVNRLQRHDVSDLYYIPLLFIDAGELETTYVALLRQFNILLLSDIHSVKGIRCIGLSKDPESVSTPISRAQQYQFGRIGRLTSPYNEHFLQRATYLFYRVGVTDIRISNVESVLEGLTCMT